MIKIGDRVKVLADGFKISNKITTVISIEDRPEHVKYYLVEGCDNVLFHEKNIKLVGNIEII